VCLHSPHLWMHLCISDAFFPFSFYLNVLNNAKQIKLISLYLLYIFSFPTSLDAGTMLLISNYHCTIFYNFSLPILHLLKILVITLLSWRLLCGKHNIQHHLSHWMLCLRLSAGVNSPHSRKEGLFLQHKQKAIFL